jgi:NAD(P)H dehydrogenase (quinone)
MTSRRHRGPRQRHLVVFSHPNPSSFNARVRRAYVDELERQGHAVVLRDLYALKFDPVLRIEDFEGARSGRAPEDVRAEQEHVSWADVITFISPIWWIGWPAMLKGYVDRVFSLGFAYRYTPGGVEGCLGGKRAVIVTSSGSTMDNFVETGKLASVRTAQDVYTMEFCAIAMVEHLHFAPVGRRTAPERFDQMLAEVRELVRRHFGGVSS